MRFDWNLHESALGLRVQNTCHFPVEKFVDYGLKAPHKKSYLPTCQTRSRLVRDQNSLFF
jgi:hypothetical protein